MPDVTKQAFVEAELFWLLEGCLSDLREAATNPATKYEAVLAICETTSALVKRFDALNIGRDEPEAARSAPDEIPMKTIMLLSEVLSGVRQHCQACGGWRANE